MYKLMVNGKVMKSSLSANSKLNFIEKLIQKMGYFDILTQNSISINQVWHGFYHWFLIFPPTFPWSIFDAYFILVSISNFWEWFHWRTSQSILSIIYNVCRYYLPLWHLLLKVPYKGRLDNTKIGTDLSTKSFLNLQL